MRIGELARRAGVSVRALRYYEEQGLLVPDRTSIGQREYVESDVDRVRFIQYLFSAGLPSKSIIHLLPFLDTDIVTPEMTGQLSAERERIQNHLDDLARARDHLDDLLFFAATQQSSGSTVHRCWAPSLPRRNQRS